MAYLNLRDHFTLTGRVGGDVRVAGNGTKVAYFSIVIDNFKDKSGNKVADFIECKAFGTTAEFALKYFTKGKAVQVGGVIRQSHFVDKDGQKRNGIDLVVDTVDFVPTGTGAGNGASKPQGQGYSKAGNQNVVEEVDYSDYAESADSYYG